MTSSANRFAPALPTVAPGAVIVIVAAPPSPVVMLSVPVLAPPKPSARPPEIVVAVGVDGAVWLADRDAEKNADGDVDEFAGFDGDTLGDRYAMLSFFSSSE